MTRQWILLAVLAFMWLPALAEEEAPHRIAYVNAPWILNNSPQIKVVEQALKKAFSEREEALRKRQDELDALEDRLREEGQDLGEDEARQLERELVSGKRRLKISQQEFQEEVALRQNEELNKLRRQIREVVQAVAKSKRVDMVFETAVVFVSDRVDISKDVLDRLKQEFRATGFEGAGQ
jgi:outer membrane protein